jgi:hypothetical protein
MSTAKIVIVGDKVLFETCKNDIVWPDGNAEVLYASTKDAPKCVLALAPRDIIVVDGCDLNLIELLSFSLARSLVVASKNKKHRTLAMTKGCNYQCAKKQTAIVLGALLEMEHF